MWKSLTAPFNQLNNAVATDEDFDRRKKEELTSIAKSLAKTLSKERVEEMTLLATSIARAGSSKQRKSASNHSRIDTQSSSSSSSSEQSEDDESVTENDGRSDIGDDDDSSKLHNEEIRRDSNHHQEDNFSSASSMLFSPSDEVSQSDSTTNTTNITKDGDVKSINPSLIQTRKRRITARTDRSSRKGDEVPPTIVLPKQKFKVRPSPSSSSSSSASAHVEGASSSARRSSQDSRKHSTNQTTERGSAHRKKKLPTGSHRKTSHQGNNIMFGESHQHHSESRNGDQSSYSDSYSGDDDGGHYSDNGGSDNNHNKSCCSRIFCCCSRNKKGSTTHSSGNNDHSHNRKNAKSSNCCYYIWRILGFILLLFLLGLLIWFASFLMCNTGLFCFGWYNPQSRLYKQSPLLAPIHITVISVPYIGSSVRYCAWWIVSNWSMSSSSTSTITPVDADQIVPATNNIVVPSRTASPLQPTKIETGMSYYDARDILEQFNRLVEKYQSIIVSNSVGSRSNANRACIGLLSQNPKFKQMEGVRDDLLRIATCDFVNVETMSRNVDALLKPFASSSLSSEFKQVLTTFIEKEEDQRIIAESIILSPKRI